MWKGSVSSTEEGLSPEDKRKRYNTSISDSELSSEPDDVIHLLNMAEAVMPKLDLVLEKLVKVESKLKELESYAKSVPVQNFYQHLAKITEIPPRLARSRQHFYEFLNHSKISYITPRLARSRRDCRDLAKIAEVLPILHRSRHDVCDLDEIAARFSTSRRDLAKISP